MPETRTVVRALITVLRGVLGTVIAIATLLLLLAFFYSRFVDLSAGEGLRDRPYGDALLVLFWLLAAALGGFAAAWRAPSRLQPGLVTGVLLLVAFTFARQLILPDTDLSAPAPAMVTWIYLLLLPAALAGTSAAPSGAA